MKRSKRFEVLEQRPVNLDGFAYEWKEKGLVAMDSPYDPEPGIRIENGIIVEMDGVKRENFDFIDSLIADHGIDVNMAEYAMNLDSLEIARKMVDINVSREEVVKICCGCTPAKLVDVVKNMTSIELMMAQTKMRVRKSIANQAHSANVEDNPVLMAADTAEMGARGFAEMETTAGVARYAPFNAIALLIGSQTGKPGSLTQCSMEEVTELKLGIKGLTSYAETLSVYGTEKVFVYGGDSAYSKAFLASAYASRGIKVRFTSGTGSEVLMGETEGKSMLYLEARCIYTIKACGVQGIQNGGSACVPISTCVPEGFRSVAAENLMVSMLNMECASGNDSPFSHSEFRRAGFLMMQFIPGTDFITSGYSGIPHDDNTFCGAHVDCNDYDDWYALQRDMRVDGGLVPIKEYEAIAVRNKAAKACQAVFRYLNLPEITDEEVEAATYAYDSKDMPARDKNADMKAATELMEKDITALDIVKALYDDGYEDIASNILELLKQRVIGDYLHTSAIFDEKFNVLSAVNDTNDYMGPGTGYHLKGERWDKIKDKPTALKADKFMKIDTDKACVEEIGPACKGTNPNEVVIAVTPAFGTSVNESLTNVSVKDNIKEICAGIEEEGMEYRIIKVFNSTDLGVVGNMGAKLSGSGIAVGLQSKGTTVIHQADLTPLSNLELFSQAPLIEADTYRKIGRNAARYAKGNMPVPIDMLNDYTVPAKYLVKAALINYAEEEMYDGDKEPADVRLK